MIKIKYFLFPQFFNKQIQILFFVFMSLLFILGGTLFYTQIVSNEHYLTRSTKNRVRRILVEAPRGKILDRNGFVLVDNRPRFDLVLIREELPKDKKEYVEFLAQFLEISQKKIWKTLQKTALLPYLPAVLLRDVDLALVAKVEERNREFPALHVQVEPTRYYVLGEDTSHLLGTVGKIPREEVDHWQAKGVQLQETVGRSGIERVLDESLRGTVGGMQVQVNNRGYLDDVLGSRNPVPGEDLILSLDWRLQKRMAELLSGKQGAGVMLDVKTGEVLALVSQPGFDPNLFISRKEPEKINEIFKNSKRPLFGRAFKGMYSPGSLFKLIVALAYMEEYLVEWEQRFVFCDGVFELGKARFRCWKRGGHGSVDLIDAIKYSCNFYFYTIGLEVGPEKIAAMASRFGFGKKTGFLLGEKKGLIPTPKWKKKKYRERWYGGDTANFSIGQGAVLCTPLQMATMISAIASEGIWRSPGLIHNQSNKEIDLTDLAFSLRQVKEGMRRVVQDPGGTGKRAWVAEMPGAGKTGTVEVSLGRGKKIKHAWFGGFAPYEDPEIVVVFLVEEGQSGGVTAAPLAREMFKKYAEITQKEIS